jgi:hypothetical protein
VPLCRCRAVQSSAAVGRKEGRKGAAGTGVVQREDEGKDEVDGGKGRGRGGETKLGVSYCGLRR